MKLLRATGLIVAMLSLATADERTVSLEGVTRAEQIIGQLGRPLGTVVKVKGMVRIAELPGKDGKPEVVGHFLVISHVDDKMLDTPLELEIFPTRAAKLKQGDTIETKGYERLMTYGMPSEIPRKNLPQARGSSLEYHLKWYIDIEEE